MSSGCPLDDVLQTYTNGHTIEVLKHWLHGGEGSVGPRDYVKALYSFTTTVRSECTDLRSPEGTKPTFEITQHQNLVTSVDPLALTSGVLHDALARASLYAKHEGPIRTLCSQVYKTLPDTLAIVLLRSSRDGNDIDTRPMVSPLTIDFANDDYNPLLSHDCEPRKYQLVGVILCERPDPKSLQVGYAALVRSPKSERWFTVSNVDAMDDYETTGIPTPHAEIVQYLENPPPGWFVYRLLYRWSRHVLPTCAASAMPDAFLDLFESNEDRRKAYMDDVFASHLPNSIVHPHTWKVVLENAPRLDLVRNVDYAAYMETPPVLATRMNADLITREALKHVVFSKATSNTPFYVPLIGFQTFFTFRVRSWMAICKAALLYPVDSFEDAKLAMEVALKEWLELPQRLRIGWVRVANYFNELFYGRFASRDMLEPARKSSPLALFHEQWPLLAYAATNPAFMSLHPNSAPLLVPESARLELAKDRQLRRQIANEGRSEIQEVFGILALMRDEMCDNGISMSQAVCQTWAILLSWLGKNMLVHAVLRPDLIVERYGARDLRDVMCEQMRCARPKDGSIDSVGSTFSAFLNSHVPLAMNEELTNPYINYVSSPKFKLEPRMYEQELGATELILPQDLVDPLTASSTWTCLDIASMDGASIREALRLHAFHFQYFAHTCTDQTHAEEREHDALLTRKKARRFKLNNIPDTIAVRVGARPAMKRHSSHKIDCDGTVHWQEDYEHALMEDTKQLVRMKMGAQTVFASELGVCPLPDRASEFTNGDSNTTADHDYVLVGVLVTKRPCKYGRDGSRWPVSAKVTTDTWDCLTTTCQPPTLIDDDQRVELLIRLTSWGRQPSVPKKVEICPLSARQVQALLTAALAVLRISTGHLTGGTGESMEDAMKNWQMGNVAKKPGLLAQHFSQTVHILAELHDYALCPWLFQTVLSIVHRHLPAIKGELQSRIDLACKNMEYEHALFVRQVTEGGQPPVPAEPQVIKGMIAKVFGPASQWKLESGETAEEAARRQQPLFTPECPALLSYKAYLNRSRSAGQSENWALKEWARTDDSKRHDCLYSPDAVSATLPQEIEAGRHANGDQETVVLYYRTRRALERERNCIIGLASWEQWEWHSWPSEQPQQPLTKIDQSLALMARSVFMRTELHHYVHKTSRAQQALNHLRLFMLWISTVHDPKRQSMALRILYDDTVDPVEFATFLGGRSYKKRGLIAFYERGAPEKNSCLDRCDGTGPSGPTMTEPCTDAMLAAIAARDEERKQREAEQEAAQRDARERVKAEQEAARKEARERAKAQFEEDRARSDAVLAAAKKAQRERHALARWHSWPGKLLERKAAREATLERKEKKKAEEEAARKAREAKKDAKEKEKMSAAKAARAEKVAARKAARACKKNWVDPAKIEEARKAKHSKEESDRKAEAERANKEAEARREAAYQAAREAAAPAQAEADASAANAMARAAARAAKKAADRVAAAEAAAIVEAVETAEAIAAVEAIEAAETAVAPPSPASTSTLASTAVSMAASSWEPELTIDIECLICMENRMDTMCLPCTHLCVCSKCVAGTSLSVCPKCRTPIERFQSVCW